MFTFHFSSHTLHLFCLFAPISSCFPSFFFLRVLSFSHAYASASSPFFFFLHSPSTRSEARNFCLGGPSCNTNIFIKTTLIYIYIYTHTCAFFIIYTHTHIYTLFYLISYINTPTQHQKKKRKKKGLSTFNQSYV